MELSSPTGKNRTNGAPLDANGNKRIPVIQFASMIERKRQDSRDIPLEPIGPVLAGATRQHGYGRGPIRETSERRSRTALTMASTPRQPTERATIAAPHGVSSQATVKTSGTIHKRKTPITASALRVLLCLPMAKSVSQSFNGKPHRDTASQPGRKPPRVSH